VECGDQEKKESGKKVDKSEFPVSPEMENSHWLKGDKNAITLTTGNHDCVQACFAAESSCHHSCAVICDGAVCLK